MLLLQTSATVAIRSPCRGRQQMLLTLLTKVNNISE